MCQGRVERHATALEQDEVEETRVIDFDDVDEDRDEDLHRPFGVCGLSADRFFAQHLGPGGAPADEPRR